jgi:translation initiation factor 1
VAREKKRRIPTDAAPAAWANPFAALDLGLLPAEPACAQPGGKGAPSVQGLPNNKKTRIERLLLRRSTAHRGGKTVLVLEGFSPAWSATKLQDLLHELKTSLGCGGKIEGRQLELQGELAERLLPLLEARKFAVKRGW